MTEKINKIKFTESLNAKSLKANDSGVKMEFDLHNHIKMLFVLSSEEAIIKLTNFANYSGYNLTPNQLISKIEYVLNNFKIKEISKTLSKNENYYYSFEFDPAKEKENIKEHEAALVSIGTVLEQSGYNMKTIDKSKGGDLRKYEKTDLKEVSTNTFAKFYMSGLFFTKTALNHYSIKNIDLLRNHPEAVFIRDLDKYEMLIFLYATNLYRAGIEKINYNPTEIRNFFKIKSTRANEYIIQAFKTLRKKEVVLFNKVKERIFVGTLLNWVEYDLNDKENVIYHIDNKVIGFFTKDVIIGSYIQMKTIDFQTFATLSKEQRNYLLALMYVGNSAKVQSYKNDYKSFAGAFMGVKVNNENKSKDAIRNSNKRAKKNIIIVLNLLKKKKAFLIKINENDFTIKSHSVNKKIANKPVQKKINM